MLSYPLKIIFWNCLCLIKMIKYPVQLHVLHSKHSIRRFPATPRYVPFTPQRVFENSVSSVIWYSESILRTSSFCARCLNWHVYVSRLPKENSSIYLILIAWKILLISTVRRLWILMLSLWLQRIYRLERRNNRNNRYCRSKLCIGLITLRYHRLSANLSPQ